MSLLVCMASNSEIPKKVRENGNAKLGQTAILFPFDVQTRTCTNSFEKQLFSYVYLDI